MHSLFSRPVLSVLFATALLGQTVYANTLFSDKEYDEDEKPWQEIEAKLPPYPQATNLVEFDAIGGTSSKFFVDESSLSIGEDGVVRYVLIIRAASGAETVSYEGIRCTSKEYRLYAMGAQGKWSKARGNAWQGISRLGLARIRNVLADDLLCDGKLTWRSVEVMRDLLRRGGTVKPP